MYHDTQRGNADFTFPLVLGSIVTERTLHQDNRAQLLGNGTSGSSQDELFAASLYKSPRRFGSSRAEHLRLREEFKAEVQAFMSAGEFVGRYLKTSRGQRHQSLRKFRDNHL